LNNIKDLNIGLLSQSDIMNCIPNRDTRITHSLIVSGYIEEVTRRIKATQIEVTFYRLTEKGHMVFAPIYKRFWFSIKGDVRTIIVAAITALVVSMISGLFGV